MTKATIVIVEDHPIMMDAIATLLEQRGYGVIGKALGGEEGLSLVLKHRPDIALMDIEMEALSGLDVAKSLQSQYPEVKVLLMTSFSYARYIARALKIGVEGYILKSMSSETLTTAIETLQSGNTFYPAHLMQIYLEFSDYKLTERELDVLRLVGKGYTSREVAQRLNLAIDTVDGHRKKIIQKTGTNSVVDFARVHGYF